MISHSATLLGEKFVLQWISQGQVSYWTGKGWSDKKEEAQQFDSESFWPMRNAMNTGTFSLEAAKP